MVESVLAAHTKSAAADPEEQQLLNDVELKPTSKAAHSRAERGHWPGVLLASVVLALLTRMATHRQSWLAEHVQGGVLLPEAPQLSLFEQQLAGCRTFKAQPIPSVDTSASLRALDAHTPEQRQQAQAFTAAVSACANFRCLRQANKLPRAPGQFRFPHFMVIGFPKCATTSIYCHLIQHPQVQYAKDKESHRLTDKCRPLLEQCPAQEQRDYLVDILNMEEAAAASFTKAAFDGSTHYAQEGGWLAAQMAEALPWVKVVVSMRDPISQALAMFLHNYMHNRTAACWETNGQRVYTCVVADLQAEDRARYGPTIQKWVEAFPGEQLHIVQFESLTSRQTMGEAMKGLKSFLGLDPTQPSDKLPLTNWKHKRGDENSVGRYWNITRGEYTHLVELARRNTVEVLKVMGSAGLVDSKAKVEWMRSWERVWRNNLDNNCEEGEQGSCKIVVS
ncbi:sulfotransferase [Micractinium conductrix]|uniref:Sulfotransferase n=1 Tax=Micractinium conductrix TaxID=554055 RepID=A0A2P6V1Y2_9CHLO|nr:sulfotransferase [Micractinium conductrix]|eukprot:PSC68106.1 sulfotransferase [Micractinium conductrix]